MNVGSPENSGHQQHCAERFHAASVGTRDASLDGERMK
jgi:hypothetical protein